MSFVGTSAVTVTLIVELGSAVKSLEPQEVSVIWPLKAWPAVLVMFLAKSASAPSAFASAAAAFSPERWADEPPSVRDSTTAVVTSKTSRTSQRGRNAYLRLP